MIYGYSIIDPLIVFSGFLLMVAVIFNKPSKMVLVFPTIGSLYFFVNILNLLTLSKILPLLLLSRIFIRGNIVIPKETKSIFFAIAATMVIIVSLTLIDNFNINRIITRTVNYLGLIAIFFFFYEVTRKQFNLNIILKGFIVAGIIFSAYGIYQIIAFRFGLPFRAIVRGEFGVTVAFEAGILRINSLASEPKRLGFILFISSLACFFFNTRTKNDVITMRIMGSVFLLISFFTFAWSYFISLFILTFLAMIIYPRYIFRFLIFLTAIIIICLLVFDQSYLIDALILGGDRRFNEFEFGLDANKVYRQEFFAWDYLLKHPHISILGVGVGQYAFVFFDYYGYGAGLGDGGAFLPLNSNFLVMLYDFGLIFTGLIYGSLFLLINRLYRRKHNFLCLSIIFLILQSFTIIVDHYIAFFAGISCACLQYERLQRRFAKSMNERKLRSIGST